MLNIRRTWVAHFSRLHTDESTYTMLKIVSFERTNNTLLCKNNKSPMRLGTHTDRFMMITHIKNPWESETIEQQLQITHIEEHWIVVWIGIAVGRALNHIFSMNGSLKAVWCTDEIITHYVRSFLKITLGSDSVSVVYNYRVHKIVLSANTLSQKQCSAFNGYYDRPTEF